MDYNLIIRMLWVASLVHVGIESVRMKRVGRPFWHIALVGLAAWPLSYLFWVLYWPGTLLKKKSKLDSEKWVENLFRRKKGCEPIT